MCDLSDFNKFCCVNIQESLQNLITESNDNIKESLKKLMDINYTSEINNNLSKIETDINNIILESNKNYNSIILNSQRYLIENIEIQPIYNLDDLVSLLVENINTIVNLFPKPNNPDDLLLEKIFNIINDDNYFNNFVDILLGVKNNDSLNGVKEMLLIEKKYNYKRIKTIILIAFVGYITVEINQLNVTYLIKSPIILSLNIIEKKLLDYFTDINILITKNEFYTHFQQVQVTILNKLNESDKKVYIPLFANYYSTKFDLWLNYSSMIFKSTHAISDIVFCQFSLFSNDILTTLSNPLSVVSINFYIFYILNKALITNQEITSNIENKIIYVKHRESLPYFIDDLNNFYSSLSSIDLASSSSLNIETFTKTFTSEVIGNEIGFSIASLDSIKQNFFRKNTWMKFFLYVNGSNSSTSYVDGLSSSLSLLLDLLNQRSFKQNELNTIINDINKICIEKNIDNSYLTNYINSNK